MVSSDNFLNDPGCKITFTVYTDYSDKQLGDVFSKNNKLLTSSRKYLLI